MQLAGLPDLQLRVLVPDRWKHYGRWRRADVEPGDPTFEVRRVALPWAGPAQTYLHFYPRLRRVLTALQPDVIDLWEEPWSLVSVQACRLRRRVCPDAAVVSETEQNLSKVLPAPFERFRRYTLSEADHVIGRSSEAVEIVGRKGYRGPASVLPNAVDVDLFRPMDREACRSALGLPLQGRVLGYVGRLVEEKGLRDLIRALPRLSSTDVVLVGRGPARSDLENEAERLGVGDRVHWVGPQPLASLPALMNAFDALVLPSRTTESWKEQFGRVLIEAEACGVPALGSDSGAIPEVIDDARRVFAERDPAALADCVERFWSDLHWERAEARHGLRRRVVEGFSWKSVAGRYAELYRSVVSRRRGPAAVIQEASGPLV